MSERRKTDRRSPYYYLRVFEKGNRCKNGRLIDLSPFGLTLICEEPFKKMELYKFQMNLPETIRDRKQMTFDTQCVWCREDSDPGYWMAGFQLVNLSDRNRRTIESLYTS